MSAFGMAINYTGQTKPNASDRPKIPNNFAFSGNNQSKVTSGMATPNYGSGQREMDFSAYRPQSGNTRVSNVTGGGYPTRGGQQGNTRASNVTGGGEARRGDVTTMAMGEEDGYAPPPANPRTPSQGTPRLPPGMATTLAMGEEDGYAAPPVRPAPPARPPANDQTTLAMGEEDGGAPVVSYGGGGFSQNGFSNLAPPMGGMPAGFGAPPNVSFGFAGFGGPPFSAAYQGFDGTVSGNPNYTQRDAFINNINNQLGMQQMQGFNTPRPAPPQLDFGQLWSQAGDMARGGWTNPLAGLFR